MSGLLAAWIPWVQALGWALLHFVWQGMVVGAAYAAVRALLPKVHCNARYAAGLGALAVLALWPLATFIALRPQGVPDAVAGIVVTQPGVELAAMAAVEPALAATIGHALPWLVLLWGIGVFAMAGRALREWRGLARIAREWAESNAELDAMLHALTRRFGFVRRVRVLVSGRVDTPMLIGWLKPVVLLPTAVALGFPRQQVELILAHELGHLRRYDHLVNLAQALLETLLFYHPVVHWISREVRNERELCCDALVLRQTRGEPREYARTLAALEELRQGAVPLALAASGGELLERVRRIVGMPAPRLTAEPQGAGRWLMLVAAFGMVLLAAMRVEHDEAPFLAPGLSIDWLAQPDLRVLPLAALTLPLERPRLRLAVPAAVTGPPLPETSVPPTVPMALQVSPAPTPMAPEVSPIQSAPIAPPAATSVAPVPPPAIASIAPTPSSTSVQAEPASATRKPVALHAVAPKFPSYARREAGRVVASFAIAADGSVSDLRFEQSDAGSAFVRAADRALRQWRFDPATLPGDRAIRYTQTFVFAPRGASGATSREECVQSTGSLICRDPGDALARSYSAR